MRLVPVLASSTPWPALALGVVVVLAVCLWLLFRPGSIADRARRDDPDTTGPEGPDQSGAGGR